MRTLVPFCMVLLLAACDSDDGRIVYAADIAIARDSELCRAAVADALSRERAALNMNNNAARMAFEQRYQTCLAGKGYTLPPANAPSRGY